MCASSSPGGRAVLFPPHAPAAVRVRALPVPPMQSCGGSAASPLFPARNRGKISSKPEDQDPKQTATGSPRAARSRLDPWSPAKLHANVLRVAESSHNGEFN